MPLLLLLFIAHAFAITKSDFFPKFPVQNIVEEREFEKSIERSLERQGKTYRYVVNYKAVGPITKEVAVPVLELSMFWFCSATDTEPVTVNYHYESAYEEAFFICTRTKNYDPIKSRETLKAKYCSEKLIQSKAQEIICKELMLL